MGNNSSLTVVYDKKPAVFSPGDVIKGKVNITVGEEGLQKIKGIWVQFSGKATVKFTSFNGRYDEEHSQEETYLTGTRVVFGTGNGQVDKPGLSLPAGQHSFPFSFRLPTNCTLPSSFSGCHGQIQYEARATLAIIRKIINKECHGKSVSFTVRGPKVDLNLLSSVKAPVKCNTEVRNLFGIGLQKGTTVSFHLTKRGYVPNDKIPVSGRVDNREGDEQRNFEATLVQEVTFIVEEFICNETKTKKIILSRSSASTACPRGKVIDFTMVPLRVPPGSPSTGMPGCKIIDVQYFVKCNSPGCIETSFPIKIGTVPLRATSKVPTAAEALPLPMEEKPSAKKLSVTTPSVKTSSSIVKG